MKTRLTLYREYPRRGEPDEYLMLDACDVESIITGEKRRAFEGSSRVMTITTKSGSVFTVYHDEAFVQLVALS